MPFLYERTQSKRLTEGEMRAIFDEIDKDGSGVVDREEFAYLFCKKLQLLSQHEIEAMLSLLDRWAQHVCRSLCGSAVVLAERTFPSLSIMNNEITPSARIRHKRACIRHKMSS